MALVVELCVCTYTLTQTRHTQAHSCSLTLTHTHTQSDLLVKEKSSLGQKVPEGTLKAPR